MLKEDPDERSVRLIPVALIVLREYGKGKTSVETGWIDLTEWAMLAVWRARSASANDKVQQAVLEMWFGIYLAELDRFYSMHSAALAVPDSLDRSRSGSFLDAINASVLCYWHLARIGLLAMGYQEVLSESTPDESQKKAVVLNTIAEWQIGLLNANQSAYRPLLDLNHIELFLSWRTFLQVHRREDIYRWLDTLQRRLVVRRIGVGMLPFIEGGNSLDLVFEYVATGHKPPEFCDQSSLLILCLLEFCFSLEENKRDELVGRIYRHIVLGADMHGKLSGDHLPIDLMGWEPPTNWYEGILSKTLREDGDAQIVGQLADSKEIEDARITARIREFIDQSRAKKLTFPEYLPESVVVLACLKHRSPLPPELWRNPIFGPIESRPAKHP